MARARLAVLTTFAFACASSNACGPLPLCNVDADCAAGVCNGGVCSPGDRAGGGGVGDACDPHPSVPGDSIAFFDAFAGSALAPTWSAPIDASVSVSGDALHIASLSGTDVLSQPLSIGDGTVVVDVTVTAQSGSGF